MRVTRRTFLAGAAAGIPASLIALAGRTKHETRKSKLALDFDIPISSFSSSGACALVDLPDHCAFPESVMGYRAALADASISIVSGERPTAPDCPMLIIPAANEVSSRLVRMIRAQLAKGGHVLLESGATFARPEEFQAHRARLQGELSICIEPPVDLARGGCGRGRVPYVDYVWPFAVKVRDFSRVIPVEAPGCEVIGRAGCVPVALKRQVGRGRLIFLGSPLGPVLWAGDDEARRWLGAVVR